MKGNELDAYSYCNFCPRFSSSGVGSICRMNMDVRINGSREANDGVVVYLENGEDKDFYYMSSIAAEGDKDDVPGERTMWGWINHMREKNWWNGELERDFIKVCRQHLNHG